MSGTAPGSLRGAFQSPRARATRVEYHRPVSEGVKIYLIVSASTALVTVGIVAGVFIAMALAA